MLEYIESLCKLVAEICLIIFYFTDHYETLYDFAIFEFEKSRVDKFGDFGLLARMWMSVLVVSGYLVGKFKKVI